MEQRALGKTGLQVTPIGLGLAALGRPGYINIGHGEDLRAGLSRKAMEVHCHHMLDTAWELGIRYFDAARSYGEAEAFLAGWLRRRGHRPAVGSKWGYRYTADWRVDAEVHELKEHTAANLARQCKESRENLAPWLGLYQIHSATLESGVLDDTVVLDHLARIKASGVVVGLSLSGPRQAETLARALDIRRDDTRLFDCVQATWNLLEPSCGVVLALAHEAGMGVIVKEAVANGRLTARNGDRAFTGSMRLLEQESERLNTTVDGLAIAAVLARPWVDMVLSGAASEDQLRANVGALAVAWDVEAESRIARLQEPAEEYWRTRSTLAWN